MTNNTLVWMASKTGEYLQMVCMECGGEGEISMCCQDSIYQGRCACCGRYSKTDVCCNCNGYGVLEYRVGDEVEVFVCVWSPEYLKDLLYVPKKVGDRKS